MVLNGDRGIQTVRFNTNQQLIAADVNALGYYTYQNTADIMAMLAYYGVEDGTGPDRVISGLLLEWDASLTSKLRAGASVSYTGRYYTDDVWGFQAETGKPFLVTLPADADVTVDPGGAQARYDTIEIRPQRTALDSDVRAFRDPITGIQTNASTATRYEYACEIQILKGTEGAGVAPTHTAGWIKVAEVYVGAGASSISQSDIKDVRDSDAWTSESESTLYSSTAGSNVFEKLYVGSGVDGVDRGPALQVYGDITAGVPATFGNDVVSVFARASLASDDAAIAIVAGDTGNSIIYFGDSSSATAASLKYDHDPTWAMFELSHRFVVPNNAGYWTRTSGGDLYSVFALSGDDTFTIGSAASGLGDTYIHASGYSGAIRIQATTGYVAIGNGTPSTYQLRVFGYAYAARVYAGVFSGNTAGTDGELRWDNTYKYYEYLVGSTWYALGILKRVATENYVAGTLSGTDLAVGAQGNVLLGYNTGNNITTGDDNIAIGYNVLGTDVGTNNIAIGTLVGTSMTSAGYNILIGRTAGLNLQTGGYNVAIGYQAFQGVATTSAAADRNTFVGAYAGSRYTGGSSTLIGFGAGQYIEGGSQNVAVGFGALTGVVSASSGSYNIAMGVNALNDVTTGINNVGIGHEAADKLTQGSHNTAIGRDALSTGLLISHSIAIGYAAGMYETAGAKLYIDAYDRLTESGGQTDSIIYGVMNSVVANQKLYFNATTYIRNGLNIGSSDDPWRELQIVSAEPTVVWKETDGGTNQQYWRARASGAAFRIDALNDALDASSNALAITNTNGVVTSVALSTSGTPRVSIASDGTITFGAIAILNSTGLFVGGTTTPALPMAVKSQTAGSATIQAWYADDGGLVATVVKGAADDGYFRVYDGSGTAKVQLHSADDSYFLGGNVGVGIADAQRLFHIAAESGYVFRIERLTPASGGISMEFYDDDATYPVDWKFGLAGSTNSQDMYLYDNSGGGGYVMYWKRGGGVAIGTNTVSGHKLTVVGSNAKHIRVGTSATNDGGYIMGYNAYIMALSSGGEFTGVNITDVNAWTARSIRSTGMWLYGDSIIFTVNTGLTAGNTFTPTTVFTITASGPQFSSDILINGNYGIHRGGSDGSDYGTAFLAGGGDDSYTRGSYILVSGNENGTYHGAMRLHAGGDASGGYIDMLTQNVRRFIVSYAGYVGVGTDTGTLASQMTVKQPSSTAAIPVLELNQVDVSEPFVKLVGTAASATLTNSLVAEADVTTATRVGWLKVNIDDAGNQITDGVYYIPFYSLA